VRLLAALVCGAWVLVLAGSALATTWPVPSPQCPTIQAGIDSAAAGDTVLVADGTYTGTANRDLDFSGKAIVVMSENGPEVTIIDCEALGRGFFFHSGEDASSIVKGFTIQNGAVGDGGGIRCNGSSPTIEGNIITANAATNRGGGIFCRLACSPILRGNTISGNTAIDGGGIYCRQGTSPTIDGNTISGNTASDEGGGIYTDSSTPIVVNSILWGNSAATDPEIHLASGSIQVTYSDIQGGWAGAGNIDADPLFVTGPLGNYYLSQIAAGQLQESPCVDAGDPGSPVPEATTRTDGAPDLFPADMGYHYRWNRPPDLVDQADTTVVENQYLTFTLVATDPDGDSISYSSPDLPAGATLNSATGVFEWTPTYAQAGLYTARVIATDNGPSALADTEQVDITVTDIDGPPDLIDQADTTVAENQYLTFTLMATDPDGDTISLSSPDLPTGAMLNSVTGVFEWTPAYDQGGNHPITFLATDNGSPALADTEQTVITVGNVNRPPSLSDQADTTVAENDLLTFTLAASDPDGDSLSFSSPDLPTGATLNSVTGVFEWTPAYDQAGAYTVTFIATDDGVPALADTTRTDITVTDVTEVAGEEDELTLPLSRYLAQNYPNPFSATTTITYGLIAPTRVTLSIYDIRGALVRRLKEETVPAGRHRVTWDGRDERGHRVASGMYFCRLEAGDFSETRRMIIVR